MFLFHLKKKGVLDFEKKNVLQAKFTSIGTRIYTHTVALNEEYNLYVYLYMYTYIIHSIAAGWTLGNPCKEKQSPSTITLRENNPNIIRVTCIMLIHKW